MNIKKLCKNKKGFTLIEIIVVVVILAVLMAVAVPSVLKYIGEADNAKYMSQARGQMIATQAELVDSYATSQTKASWIANPTDVVAGSPSVGGVLVSSTVASVTDKGVLSGETALTAGQTPEQIASYVVFFGGENKDTAEAIAVITPNGSVTVGVK